MRRRGDSERAEARPAASLQGRVQRARGGGSSVWPTPSKSKTEAAAFGCVLDPGWWRGKGGPKNLRTLQQLLLTAAVVNSSTRYLDDN